MGKDPDDIAGEIEGLRKESDVIVDELLRRANPGNVARGMTSTLTERAGSVVGEASTRVNGAAATLSRVAGQVGADIPAPIREHRMAATYATVGLVAGLAGFAISWFSVMRAQTPADRAAEAIRRYGARAGEAARSYGDRLRGFRRNADDARLVAARREPGMLKRLLWVAMASVMTTLGSMLFRRMSASLWRTTMKEPPPEK